MTPKYLDTLLNIISDVYLKSMNLYPTQIVIAFIPITTGKNAHFL
jgi:hypothetical protein